MSLNGRDLFPNPQYMIFLSLSLNGKDLLPNPPIHSRPSTPTVTPLLAKQPIHTHVHASTQTHEYIYMNLQCVRVPHFLKSLMSSCMSVCFLFFMISLCICPCLIGNIHVVYSNLNNQNYVQFDVKKFNLLLYYAL